MDDNRFDQLSEAQKQCLRLVLAHYTIKEIAAELDLHESSVNERLRRARVALGTNNSKVAARMLAGHEQAQGSWISPTGSKNTLPSEPGAASLDSSSDGGASPDDLLADIGTSRAFNSAARLPRGGRIGWPFPTKGRPDNDLSYLHRFAWMFPCSLIALLAILLIADLSIGLQDILADLSRKLARSS